MRTALWGRTACARWLRVAAAALMLWLLSAPALAENPPDFYQPLELSENDFEDPASRWCWARSARSEHFYLFWEPDFGANPNSDALPGKMRVDVPALLDAAEGFYRTDAGRLGFLHEGEGSQLERYRMEIYLMAQDEWLATGSGYDNVVGALWVNPAACSPAGSTLAHEIGHCFQYQVYCDRLLGGAEDDASAGFRYAPGNGLGNGFWEQCAQWQSYRDFPEEAFTPWDMEVWLENSHRAFEHEWTRYQSYWLMYAWAEAHGEAMLGRLWRESAAPEDAISAYGRIFLSGDVDRLYDALYDYAARCATFDFDGAREYAGDWIGGYRAAYYAAGDGAWQVGYASCPSASGFTVTELRPQAAEEEVRVSFEGLPWAAPLADGDPGLWRAGEDGGTFGGTTRRYNPLPEYAAGVAPLWRWGLVALKGDGERLYGPTGAGCAGVLRWTLSEPDARLFLVVLGAPEPWVVQPWDDDESTDIQLPYRIRLENAGIAEGYNGMKERRQADAN